MNIAQFDKAMEINFPESRAYINDAQEHVRRICEECNYLDAVRLVDWERHLKPESILLDLGCGGGWLTAYLSKFDAVKKIYALDSSKHYLHHLAPKVLDIMEGKREKVVSIEGLFTPLLFEDAHLDAVAASSALHHAENLEATLIDIRRVLKKNGLLFVLNEVPFERVAYFHLIAKSATKTLVRALLAMYKPISQSVSSSGFLDNPLLGDRIYPDWYWVEAFNRAGFEVLSRVDSRLPTVKNGKGPSLKHFVCKAI